MQTFFLPLELSCNFSCSLSICRCVTLFEELKLLKDFEKREDVFAEKVEAKEKEKNDMQQKVTYMIL